MGRKRISSRIKRIILHAGNEAAYFDLDQEERLIMNENQKKQIIKKMKIKINEVLSKGNATEVPDLEIKKDFFGHPPRFTENDDVDSAPEIPENQHETKTITITIDTNNEEQSEDQYINHLSRLFQINHHFE